MRPGAWKNVESKVRRPWRIASSLIPSENAMAAANIAFCTLWMARPSRVAGIRWVHIPLLWTHLIPATLEGRAIHNVQNAMFAAAMAFSLGIKLDAIRQGLRTFDSTFFQAPG